MLRKEYIKRERRRRRRRGRRESRATPDPPFTSSTERVVCSTPFGRSERNDGIIGGKWRQGERPLPAGDIKKTHIAL
ncbi:hypothetical protein OXB14_015680 [Bacteroides hominis]|uniref:hypothetical protein n=1 Tax=Bacteroides TaxID=816 RepID=UPI0011C177A1|nr:hypothetical protein [Bacteroides fragilis]MCM0224819.1 hypothetical protein [Bacteroides fragilis]MCS2422997.1 hypothetical protein [Bacteroides fragilis]MCY2673490.1 hypothetical protein [Bacteroides fragilis]MDA1494485.1 hypothetical protein [Bacteroides fragilis]